MRNENVILSHFQKREREMTEALQEIIKYEQFKPLTIIVIDTPYQVYDPCIRDCRWASGLCAGFNHLRAYLDYLVMTKYISPVYILPIIDMLGGIRHFHVYTMRRVPRGERFGKSW